MNFGLGFFYYETRTCFRRDVPISELQTDRIFVKLAQAVFFKLFLHRPPANCSVRSDSRCFLSQIIRRGFVPLLMGKTQNIGQS